MKVKYQVTLFNSEGKYKPVACIITIDQEDNTDRHKELKTQLLNEGIKKICNKRYWTQRELKQYNYDKAKIRMCGDQ